MPIPDSDLQALQLGALLHDIGKLYQRSGSQLSTDYRGFDRQEYGSHGAHALWSADFVQKHVASRWPIRPHDILSHHQGVPVSRTARLIALADRMAAGEREPMQAQTRPPWESQLLTVFSRLSLDGTGTAPDGYYPLRPLELERDVIFPQGERWSPEECHRGYLELWQGFEQSVDRIPEGSFDRYLETLYHLLQRYCWCVPSAAYQQTPDVSLFDHSRLTCAVATCLYHDGLSDPEIEGLLAWPPRGQNRSQPLVTMVGGDLSGLQSFLYTLSAKGAARTLRGRSFYLQLLTESAARSILHRLELPPLNALYWGGGRFYLFVPASRAEQLEQACADLEQTMLELHGGDLAIAVGSIALSADDFGREHFAACWGKLGGQISEAKTRRFGRVVRRSYGLLFAPSGSGGSREQCDSCWAELGPVSGEGEQCPFCMGMEQLGQGVVRAAGQGGAVLSVGGCPPPGTLSPWQEALGRLGCWWDFGPGADDALRYALNSPNFLPAGADGFRWAPAIVPRVEGPGSERTRDFDGIAGASLGVKRLGVLRMDVDDLGRLFGGGLGDRATASRVASLSSALRLFFEGWINRVAIEAEADREMVPADAADRSGLLYGVYSGGDDLFLVGAWDRIPLLARRIRAELEQFAMGNPSVRISAGIATVDPHLPLYQAATEAGEALDRDSKLHQRRNGRAKDAVTFLSETMGWEQFDSVRQQVAELLQLLSGPDGSRGPRALLSTLGSLAAQYRLEAGRQSPEGRPDPERLYYGRWAWMAAYSLGRARERSREEGTRASLAALQRRLGEPEVIWRLGLSVRWAEYLTRSREVDKQ